MAGVQDSLNTSERELRSIASFWGMVLNWFTRDNSQDHAEALRRANRDWDARMQVTVDRRAVEVTLPSVPLLPQKQAESRLDAQERDLDALAGLVAGLNAQAHLMSATLDEHRERLQHLATQVDDADTRTRKFTAKSAKLAKSL